MEGLTPTLPAAPSMASLTIPTPTTPSPLAGPANTIGEGTHVVGVDIQPETYRSAGLTEVGTCYWFRLADTTGDRGSTLASNGSRGPSTVTIKALDGAFQTAGCKRWTMVG